MICVTAPSRSLRANPEKAEAGLSRVDALVASIVSDADARGGSHAVGRGPYLALVEAALRRVEMPGKKTLGAFTFVLPCFRSFGALSVCGQAETRRNGFLCPLLGPQGRLRRLWQRLFLHTGGS